MFKSQQTSPGVLAELPAFRPPDRREKQPGAQLSSPLSISLVVAVISKASLVWGNAKTVMGNVTYSFACWTNIDCLGNSL